jgi:hypothetical protein
VRAIGAWCAVLALSLASATGCGRSHSSEPVAHTPTTTEEPSRFCELLVEPRKFLADEGLTFVELLTAHGVQANGVLGTIAFLSPQDVKGGNRFRPVLRFLVLRSAVEASNGSEPAPTITPAVRRNARELDRFLADGGCG